MRLPCWCAAWALATAVPASAQIVYLQNDSFVGGGLACQPGFVEGEGMAARLTATPTQYPYTIQSVRVLGCGAGFYGVVVRLYQDDGASLNPGPLIWESVNPYLIDGNNVFNDILMSSEPTPPPPITSGTVRVELSIVLQLLPPLGAGTDTNGILPQRNFIRGVSGAWGYAEASGVSGDWLLRLGIQPNTPVTLQDFAVE